jgi:hypothetical protein
MARENTSWGYKRIEGALHNLGDAICSSTVANILKQHGSEPAPTRKHTTSWSAFIKAHWEVFEGLALAAIKLWFSELVSYVLGSISHSRAISCPAAAGSNDVTPHPTTHTICVRPFHVPGTAILPARPPPIVGGVLASILPGQFRQAAWAASGKRTRWLHREMRKGQNLHGKVVGQRRDDVPLGRDLRRHRHSESGER